MNSQLIFRNIGRFLLLVLLQVLVFNNIYLGGYINPCIYVLFIAMLPTTTGKIPMMLIAFFTGMCVDFDKYNWFPHICLHSGSIPARCVAG